MNKPQHLENLKELIHQFNNHQVSVLIGAGFSKNASNLFPSWNELLEDMVKEMFSIEIRQKTRKFLIFPKHRRSEKKRVIDYIIAGNGVLNIPQMYIDFKGKREALTEYLENKFIEYCNDPNINLDIHKQLLKLPWVDICTTNYDTLLEVAEKNLGIDWECVVKAKFLCKKPIRRIIKLNGSLCLDNNTSKSKELGFDDCFDHYYIITKNDFDTYNKKHNGFSAFMQVKILQESLCLIGFSGDDPNFRYWVEWLRGTMTKGGNTAESNPIFIIDNSTNPDIDKTTELFYERNNIRWLPLKKLNETLIIDNQNKLFKKIETTEINRKTLLNKFFNYIIYKVKSWPQLTKASATVYLDKKERWDKFVYNCPQNQNIFQFTDYLFEYLLSSLNSDTENKIEDVTKVLYKIQFTLPEIYIFQNINNLLPKIQQIEPDNLRLKQFYTISFFLKHSLFVLKNIYNSDIRNSLIDFFNNINIEEIEQEEEKWYWISFALEILKDYRLVLDETNFFLWLDKINNFIPKTGFKNSEIINSIIYEEALLYANLMDREKLDSLLSHWNIKTSNISTLWLVKKAFLMNIFSFNPKSWELIEKAENFKVDVEQRLKILEIYQFYFFSTQNYRRSKRIETEITELKDKGFRTLEDTIKFLQEERLDEFTKKRATDPPEDYRFAGRSIFLGQTPEEVNHWKKIRLVRFLEEVGLNPMINKVYWPFLSKDKWTRLYMELLTSYPHQLIGYSFCFFDSDADEKYSRKLIQMLIFSSEISDSFIENLFGKIETLFLENHKKNQNIRHLFFVLAELVQALRYEVWESLWLYILDQLENDCIDNNQIRNLFLKGQVWGWEKPFKKIVTRIEDIAVLKRMLLFWFNISYSKDSTYDPETYISYIYKNPFYGNAVKELLNTRKFYRLILRDIRATAAKRTLYAFQYLPPKQQKRIIKFIKKQTLDKYELYNLAFIANKDELVSSYIKNKLYDVIKELPQNNTVSLSITKIRRLLTWSNEEKDKLFECFEIAASRVLESCNKKENDKFASLFTGKNNPKHLENILRFLQDECEDLNTKKGLNELYKSIIEKYYELRHISNWKEWIYTDDDILFRTNSLEVLAEILENKKSDLDNVYNVILQRTILLNSYFVEGLYNYIAAILYKYREKSKFFGDNSISLYVTLLNKFINGIPSDMDRIFIEKQLVQIAEILQFRKIQDINIDYWIEYKKKARFPEIREMKLNIN